MKSKFLDIFGDPVKNPKGWEKGKVEKYTDCIVPGRDKPKSFTGNIPWIRTEDLKNRGFIKESNDKIGLTKEEIEEVKGKIIPIGSVIMTCVGQLNIISINESACIINQQLHSFQCNEGMNNVFLMYSLSFQENFMYANASTTTVAYMNKTICNSIPVIKPSFNLQTQFSKIVEKVEGIKQQQEVALKEIENLYNSLMQRGFKGELSLDKVEIEKEKSDWNFNGIQEKLTDVFHEIKKGSIPFGNNLKEFYDYAIQPQILKGSYFSVDYIEKIAKGLKKGFIDNSSVIQELSGNNYSQEQIEKFANSYRIVDTTPNETESNFKLEFDSVETDFDEINGGFVTEEEAKPVLDVLKTDMSSYLNSLPPINSKDKNLIKKIRDLDFQQKQAGKIEFDEDYAIFRVLYPKFEDYKSLTFAAIFDYLHSFKDMKYDIAKSFIMNELAKKDSKFEQVYDQEMNRVELKLKL